MKNKRNQKYQTIQKIKRKEKFMDFNCKLKNDPTGARITHYGCGVIKIDFGDLKYNSSNMFLGVLGKLKNNNPNYKVTTMLFIDEDRTVRGNFNELIVNFEEKQA